MVKLAHPRQVDRLRGILDAKTHASYSGNYYTLEDGRGILRELEGFATRAEERLASRPRRPAEGDPALVLAGRRGVDPAEALREEMSL